MGDLFLHLGIDRVSEIIRGVLLPIFVAKVPRYTVLAIFSLCSLLIPFWQLSS